MKKIFAGLAAAVIILTGCGSKEAQKTDPRDDIRTLCIDTLEDYGREPVPEQYRDLAASMMYQAITDLQKEGYNTNDMGYEVEYTESFIGETIVVKVVANDSTRSISTVLIDY